MEPKLQSEVVKSSKAALKRPLKLTIYTWFFRDGFPQNKKNEGERKSE